MPTYILVLAVTNYKQEPKCTVEEIHSQYISCMFHFNLKMIRLNSLHVFVHPLMIDISSSFLAFDSNSFASSNYVLQDDQQPDVIFVTSITSSACVNDFNDG